MMAVDDALKSMVDVYCNLPMQVILGFKEPTRPTKQRN